MSSPSLSLSHRLEELYAQCPPGASVVFGDLSTGTVLRVVGTPARQEVHDAALDLAMECFCDASEAALSVSAPDGPAPIPLRATRVDGDRVYLIRRGGEEGLDALIVSLDAQSVLDGASPGEDPSAQLGQIEAACAAVVGMAQQADHD
ncbi:MAG: hypothetical protein AAGB05_06505 [Pseudomonadota bacterium]